MGGHTCGNNVAALQCLIRQPCLLHLPLVAATLGSGLTSLPRASLHSKPPAPGLLAAPNTSPIPIRAMLGLPSLLAASSWLHYSARVLLA